MPQTFEITAPNGKTLEITGDHLPNEAELQAIFTQAGVSTATPASAPEPSSALTRGATQFYEKSPLAALVGTAKGAANVVAHPLDTYFGMAPIASTVKDIAKAQWDQAVQAAQKAKEAAGGGGVLSATEALGHGLAAVLPILGPAAADVGQHFAEGDVAGGVGGAAGVLLPFAAKYGLEATQAKSLTPSAATIGAANAASVDLLRREAAQQVSERVLAPGNVRYRGDAQRLAPQLLERRLPGNRLELAQIAEEGMSDAGARIDAVTNQYGAQQPTATQPIVDALDARIKSFQVNGQTIPTAADRVAALERLRDYVKTLGPQVPFNELRKVRDEWYRAADEARMYEKRGNAQFSDIGWAAREGGSIIREEFGKLRPELMDANADYAFYKTLNDVIDPVLGRPKQGTVTTGVTGGLHTTGAIIGEGLSNIPGLKAAGALAVSKLLPAIREAQASPGWQMAEAQKKFDLAKALQRGDTGRVRAILFQITKLAPRETTPLAATGSVPTTAEDRR